jgi:predicted AlkP superfamily pyrophosphatase or phosphodiesterase
MPEAPRRVVFIIVDGMHRDAFEQVTQSGRAPALAFLKERASYVRDSIAVFPTITPAATASLATGAMPAQHGIPGMSWYDHTEQRFVNYGQSASAAFVEGISQVVDDFFYNLNSRHLSRDVRTIHEQLGDMGIVTASINFMIFRGPHVHETRPGPLKRVLFFRAREPRAIAGPKEHYFADLVTGPSGACTKLLSARGIERRIRATDAWAACVTRELLQRQAADMILFYLHENDHRSHRKGPGYQLESLADADRHVAYVLDGFPSWDHAVREVGFVVTADHSQSPVSNDTDHILDLHDVLADFELVRPQRGKERFKDSDAACAGNGRVAFFYLHPGKKERLHPAVVRTLQEVDGFDQIMWRDNGSYVVSSARGKVRFWPGNDGVRDERGNRWGFEGDLDALGGVVEGRSLTTPEYPLALWRIKGALDCRRIGDIVATTKLTYEVKDLAGGHHRGGGDHASLHAQDSTVPLVSTLGELPANPSTVDVLPHIVRHFESRRP